ncbi:MAG: RNA polymerase sporulation sigma factor SigH [Eubacteriales bacterium]|nr:RNA polymerase sporulation sigma factor SigH [Eubacteriales bacterium]
MQATVQKMSVSVLPRGYDALEDDACVRLAQAGDMAALDYLLGKYRNYVRARARSYFIAGADRDDLVQEGLIGFYKAVRDYRWDQNASFHVFADLCITRQVITAVKSATRQKHIPMNSYVSLNRPIYEEDSERTLMDVLTEGEKSNPEEMMISRESQAALEESLDAELSPLEREVLRAYLQDKTYQEISAELHRHVKSIDNALQRIKRKLERVMAQQRSA